jgi:hypothetical protein
MTDIKSTTAKAKESPQVIKARRKLEKQIANEHKRINDQALEKMAKMIENWLTRHKEERIPLKDKTIEQFDKNKHPAGIKSKFILEMLNQLKQEGTHTKPLDGRITQ